MLHSLVVKHGVAASIKTRNVYRFYMTKTQTKNTLDYKMKVSEEYELGSAMLEDADFITQNWQYAGKGDLKQTRRNIESLPSSCVRFDGQIMAFYIVDPSVPAHRNKGLGKLVEMDLSQKLIRQGYNVYKHIDIWNTPIVQNSHKYFKKSTLETGEKALLTYITY